MIRKIKIFFDQHLALEASKQVTEESLHLASAAIFIEMMHMDDIIHPQEHKVILNQLTTLFSLSTEQAHALISLATAEKKQATDYYQFTSLINKGFSQEQKIALIKTLWQIAYADGELDIYEEDMVRKIADLLHVPHLQFIKTKHQASQG